MSQICPLRLTPREREVCALLCRGATYKDIARALHLSRHVVHNYARAVYAKARVPGRGALIRCLAPLAEGTAPGPLPGLPPRMAEVATLYGRGHSRSAIARRLGLSGHTVDNYIARAYERLDVGTQGELAVLVLGSAIPYRWDYLLPDPGRSG